MQHDFLLNAIDRIPGSVRSFGARRFSRDISRLDIDIDAVVRYLRPMQRKQTKELSRFLGRDFREWRTLNA
jgi:hypothetical protein